MKLSNFTYSGPEAVEMIKNTYPKTWETEIADGQMFIKSLMKMHKLSAIDAFNKYLKAFGCPANGIATLAALHLMLEESKNSSEIKKIQSEQLKYGEQLIALEESKHISDTDKKTLRSYYLTKQDELQRSINKLILEFPVFGSQTITIKTDLFD